MITDAGKIINETEDAFILKPSPRRQLIAKSLNYVNSNVPMAMAELLVNCEQIVNLKNKNEKIFQDKFSTKLTYMPFFIKAVIESLKKFPIINSVWKEENNAIIIEVKKKINIGIAIGNSVGLMVPVIFNADQKNLHELQHEIILLRDKVKNNRVKIEETEGAAITINNYGITVDRGFPILTKNQTAILGIGRIIHRPICEDNKVVARPTLIATLIFDHRVIDGEPDANGFVLEFKNNIENFKDEWIKV
jgi:pyruvate/2-oxoglutarate dehydrogenase complex dihydrolipoamide acyltransferase (E2) component